MTGHSLVPMSARAAGIAYEDLCLMLLAQARLDDERGPAPLPTGSESQLG
jgi:D-alanine-D-alanine ligase